MGQTMMAIQCDAIKDTTLEVAMSLDSYVNMIGRKSGMKLKRRMFICIQKYVESIILDFSLQ